MNFCSEKNFNLKKTMMLAGLTGCMGISQASTVEPENSAVNKRDNDKNSKTVDYQATTLKGDIDVTRMIR